MSEFGYLNCSHSEPINFLEDSEYQLRRDHGFPLNPGQKLPNGGIILAETVVRRYAHRRDSIVLCVTNSHRPFVTWIRTISTDNPEKHDDGTPTSWFLVRDWCFDGHYHDDLNDAVVEFNERVAKKLLVVS